jgi:hypothetical protein
VATLSYKRLEFARQPGDYLVSGRITLDQGGPTYRMTLQHHPQMGNAEPLGRWTFDMRTTTNLTIVTGAAVRDRTSVLLGVQSLGRPRGEIIAYDPKQRGDPWSSTAFSDEGDGVLFLYLPGGYDPTMFAIYTTRFT